MVKLGSFGNKGCCYITVKLTVSSFLPLKESPMFEPVRKRPAAGITSIRDICNMFYVLIISVLMQFSLQLTARGLIVLGLIESRNFHILLRSATLFRI